MFLPMRVFYKIIAVGFFVLTAVSANSQQSNYAAKFATIDTLGIGYGGNVDDYIEDYINNPKQTAEALGKYIHYKPYLDSIFASFGLPPQASLLVLAASGADVFYKDEETGNAGLWAMQYRVARMYGIKMNTYVDERRDVKKTSTVSAKFFKELYLIYNDWPMAFAAYATTTLAVNKYIRLSGNSFNYWEMYDSLPRAAQEIVPSYIAAAYIFHYHKEHGITPKTHREIAYDTLVMKKWMSFEAMAPTLRTTVPVLQALNPIFKKGIIPFSTRPYVIKAPKQSKPWFRDIDTVDFEPYNSNPFVEEEVLNVNNLGTPKVEGKAYTGGDTLYHYVKRGEGLGIIAQKYGVTVDELRKWNNIKGYTIYPNQKLTIYRKD